MAALFYYSSCLIIAGSVSHIIAILCTIARLVYRTWMRHFWWEDAWAAVALITDALCLASIWLDARITSWILSVTFTSVIWAARMSIIFSIIRIANHSGCKIHKRITYLIAVSFACMWAALIAQKMSICKINECLVSESVALSQLITDAIADVSLVAAPLYLWNNVGLSRSRKILVLSAFSASILVTAITIPHSIGLFTGHTLAILILAHVKSALSLVICNLLVIVTFLYRMCSKETFDLDQSITSNQVFTSIILSQVSGSTIAEMPLSMQEEETSRQKNVAQTGATKPKNEDASMRYAEEGTSTQKH